MQEQICPVKKFLTETEKEKQFYIEQIPTSCLSQNAYYIESNGEAVIIDPMRDIENLIKLLLLLLPFGMVKRWDEMG